MSSTAILNAIADRPHECPALLLQAFAASHPDQLKLLDVGTVTTDGREWHSMRVCHEQTGIQYDLAISAVPPLEESK